MDGRDDGDVRWCCCRATVDLHVEMKDSYCVPLARLSPYGNWHPKSFLHRGADLLVIIVRRESPGRSFHAC
jgi:hypothetical protein